MGKEDSPCFKKLINILQIEFLPVYTPNVDEVKDPIQYANNVRDKMATSLDIPTYDKSGY